MEEQDKQQLAEDVIRGMLAKDEFSRWMGIEVLHIAPGHVALRMKVREEMVNGFDVCHGGVTFSLADSALAFACNSHGRLSVLLDASMTYPNKAVVGDTLTAVATEEALTNKTGLYSIRVTNQNDELVGLFKATVYRTPKSNLPKT